VKVERTVTCKNLKSEETAYFISSLPATTKAKTFNQGIRLHWSIEAFHFVKDTVFMEDKWRCKKKNSAANYSLIRNFIINLFRKNGLFKIQEAVERCANNVGFMLGLM
jgi:predicted transposase YbfD/YdcC